MPSHCVKRNASNAAWPAAMQLNAIFAQRTQGNAEQESVQQMQAMQRCPWLLCVLAAPAIPRVNNASIGENWVRTPNNNAATRGALRAMAKRSGTTRASQAESDTGAPLPRTDAASPRAGARGDPKAGHPSKCDNVDRPSGTGRLRNRATFGRVLSTFWRAQSNCGKGSYGLLGARTYVLEGPILCREDHLYLLR